MERPFATLLLCTAILAIAIACGDDGDGASPTASPNETGDSSPQPTTSPSDDTTPPPGIEGAIDLAVSAPAMAVYARATDDLLTGSTNVALGDFNDDGEPDLLVGAPGADGVDDSRPDAGEAYVIFGPLAGELDLVTADPDITIYGASPGDGLGFTVFAGDLNDDGTDDVMVGAPGVTAGFDRRTDQGRLYVFYGSDDLDDAGAFDLVEDVYDLTVTGAEGFSRLSTDVDLADLNGDGHTDLLVSSPFGGREPDTPPGSRRTAEGEGYVILGTGETLTGEYNMAAGDYDVLMGGDQEFGQFGAAFAAGDVNGDGLDDVIVGAFRNDAPNGRPSAGDAYVFFGREDMPRRLSVHDGDQDVSITGPEPGSAFGLPIVAGDFNGDGIDDFAVGAQSEGIQNLATAGSVRIFYGKEDLPTAIDLASEQADVTIPGSNAGYLLPTAIVAGDVNGDEVDDLVFSSALGGASLGRTTAGLIYVIEGGPQIPASLDIGAGEIERPIIGPAEQARAGGAMWTGEVDEDGSAGLALLAAGISPDEERANAGAVFVVRLEAE